jgi:hypothetical protein
MLLLGHTDIVNLSKWGEQYKFHVLSICYWFLKCWYILYPTNYIV